MRATGQPLLHVNILGPVEATTPAQVSVPMRQPLARALAVRLALARGEAVADDILSRDLWGDAGAGRPTARLRVLASRLRGALGEFSGALNRGPAGFSLRAEPADLIAAERALATIDAVRRTGDQARVFTTAATAVGPWRGAPLDDLAGIPFVAAERQRLQSLRLELQLAWAEAGLALGHPAGPEAEQLTRRLNFGVILGGSLNCSGLALRQLGYPVEARTMFEEAYAVWSGLQDDQGMVIAGGNLGVMDFQDGDIAAARTRGLHLLRTARNIGYSVAVLDGFGLLASIEATSGHFEPAVRLLTVAEHQREEIGAPLFIADERAALATARTLCRQALGPEADRIAESARHLPVDVLITEVLQNH